VKRLFIGVLLVLPVFAYGQGPAAKLAIPTSSSERAAYTVRANDPDPFQDGPRLPAARIGTITSARIGEGPENASAEERYNWGAPSSRDRKTTPASRSRDRTTNRDDEYDSYNDNDRRGARLRDPAEGQLTFGKRRGGPPPYPNDPPPYMADPALADAPPWWPNRERDLADLRDQLPAFGEPDRDRLAFQSDCAFDSFSSPITNPFLAEDPRSLTELRPIYMYQRIPSGHYYYQGGNIQFFGGQARVAFTERFSVVLHKLGGISINPSANAVEPGGSGFAEIWLGPKFVFWRVPESQTLASAGIQFQLPMGSLDVFQNTGSVALVPYLSIGRRMAETDYGTFYLINVAGYHLGTDDMRSDYFYNSFHLDLDYGDYHRFYPTIEVNWFHYTTNGLQRPHLFFEGRDLANIGATASGQNHISIAPGFRYRFTETLQIGVAAEFGVVGANSLNRFRLGLDLIWRY
jgi:hypothetical protein